MQLTCTLSTVLTSWSVCWENDTWL